MPTEQQPAAWHALPLPQLMQRLQAAEGGLTTADAQRRLQQFGFNRLPQQPGPTAWQIALRQFASPLIYILMLAAALSVFIGDFQDAGFIAAVLVMNAIIGASQEWKAEQSGLALRKLLQTHASVQRDQEVRDIPAEHVVPGDLVWLESGNRVPADLRLLWVHGLEVDESLLTGESLPVDKDCDWQGEASAPLGDQANMAFAGSVVTRGRGRGLVVATGLATGVGQLALDVVAMPGGQPPLLQRMERFTKVVAVATLATASLIGLLGVTLERYPPAEIFLFVVALAVSAIPEGLPVAMTVALAIATSRMAKRGVIVRRLTAVEGLGSCTLIATDKTGTLTVNELTVRELRLPDGQSLAVTGQGFAPSGHVQGAEGMIVSAQGDRPSAAQRLALAAVLCNEADLHHRDGDWHWRGDAVDVALLSLGHKLGCRREAALEQYPQVNEIPFESEHQFAATFHRVDGAIHSFVKGAPERVLAMCADAPNLVQAEEAAVAMARQGYRVLAVAQGQAGQQAVGPHAPAEPSGLTLLGLVGMIDPLRAGVREAIAQCGEAGIEVVMITGDHRVTALAIARDAGLADAESQVVTGAEMLAASPERWSDAIRGIRVFARVAPRQKLQIVQALRSQGHLVAVTGDGVNDAPALRVADIGVAMGKAGTDVAREAAELVISDDNFATIVAGVEEGRIAYDNIRKVIYLLLSAGAAELLMVLLTVMAGYHVPLLPVQLLWLNLVTDGIQSVAIAFEPGERDALRRKPRPPEESIFNRLMIERLIVGVVAIGGIGFAAFAWMIRHGWSEPEARNVLLLLMVLFENFHIGNCRSETKSAFVLSPLKSPVLLFGAIAALLVHVMAMYLPWMQPVLSTAPVSPITWLVVAALALTVVPVMELHKLSWWLRYGTARSTSAAARY